jgi:hypothetical protein
MDKTSLSAWTKTTQSGETKHQNSGRQNIPICRHKRNPGVVSLTCDDLSNLILMFLCMHIVMGFSCVDWDVVSVQVVIFDRSRTF